MADYVTFTCCNTTVPAEAVLDLLARTYGSAKMNEYLDQLSEIGINVRCPACDKIIWIKSPPACILESLRRTIPKLH